jgi:hypothetical protein
MSPSRVAETLANGVAAAPRFCDLLANLHLHLEHEVDRDRVVEIRRTNAVAVMSPADAIEQALPALGRSGALNVLLAAYSLAAPLWQIATRRRADRRLRRGTGAPTRVEPRFRIGAYPTAERYQRRSPLRIH